MSDAAELIWVTVGGKSFKASRRTVAHLQATIERLARREPSCRLVVIQGCYNTGVPASAGTHDLDAVIDVQIVGMDWWATQRFLRESGWAAWFRSPPAFTYHVHMVSLGYPGKVGIYVPGQVDDYYAHRSGLSGHVADTSWHPANIASTIFDYPGWVADQEANMPLNDADKKWIADTIRAELAKGGDTIKVANPAGGAKRSLSAILGSIYTRQKP